MTASCLCGRDSVRSNLRNADFKNSYWSLSHEKTRIDLLQSSTYVAEDSVAFFLSQNWATSLVQSRKKIKKNRGCFFFFFVLFHLCSALLWLFNSNLWAAGLCPCSLMSALARCCQEHSTEVRSRGRQRGMRGQKMPQLSLLHVWKGGLISLEGITPLNYLWGKSSNMLAIR